MTNGYSLSYFIEHRFLGQPTIRLFGQRYGSGKNLPYNATRDSTQRPAISSILADLPVLFSRHIHSRLVAFSIISKFSSIQFKIPSHLLLLVKIDSDWK